MRENRLSGSMQGRREETEGTGNCGRFNPLCPRPPTLLRMNLGGDPLNLVFLECVGNDVQKPQRGGMFIETKTVASHKESRT
jgi:hypothetical protein